MTPDAGAGPDPGPWRGMAYNRPNVEQASRMVLDFLHTHRVLDEATAQKRQVTQAVIEKSFAAWMSSGRCSEALQKLEGRGLIERHRVGHETYVFLTAPGARVAERAADQQLDSAAITGTYISGNPGLLVFDEHGNPVHGVR